MSVIVGCIGIEVIVATSASVLSDRLSKALNLIVSFDIKKCVSGVASSAGVSRQTYSHSACRLL